MRDNLFHVKPQVRLPLIGIRTVTEKALVGEDGTDVAVEADIVRDCRRRMDETPEQAEYRDSYAEHSLMHHQFRESVLQEPFL